MVELKYIFESLNVIFSLSMVILSFWSAVHYVTTIIASTGHRF